MLSNARKLIVVIGITGTQGSSVAATFLKQNDWKVRGVTRNLYSEVAKAQAAKGVELVQGDLDDVESLKRAFIGAAAIFLVTDFWTIIKQKEVIEASQAAGVFLPLWAHQREVKQGLNAVEAASDPSILTTLERFVFSTLTHVNKISSGKYTHVYHFDSKALVEQHIRQNVPQLANILSTFIMGVFVENWKKPGFLSPQKQPDGSWKFNNPHFPGPAAFEKTPFVVASRDTGEFVKALVLDLGAGTKLYGVSEFMTREEAAAVWGKALGVKAFSSQVSRDEFSDSLPELIREEMLDNFDFAKEFGFTGNDPAVRLPWDMGIKTTSVEEFVRTEDWSSLQ